MLCKPNTFKHKKYLPFDHHYIEFWNYLSETFRGIENQSWVGPCLIHSLIVIMNKEDISLQDGHLVQISSEYQYYTRDSKQ